MPQRLLSRLLAEVDCQAEEENEENQGEEVLTMEIKIGKIYRTVDGSKVEIHSRGTRADAKYDGTMTEAGGLVGNYQWYPCGGFNIPGSKQGCYDIVGEWEADQPENPPEFPISCDGAIVDGITARDYFAAAALQSLIPAIKDEGVATDDPLEFARLAAATSYVIADAMLKARAA